MIKGGERSLNLDLDFWNSRFMDFRFLEERADEMKKGLV